MILPFVRLVECPSRRLGQMARFRMVIQFGYPDELSGGLPPWRVELQPKMTKVRTIDFILRRLDHA